MLKRMFFIPLLGFGLIIGIYLFNIFHKNTPATWFTYTNNQYGFSIKHPLFLGTNFLFLPNTFSEKKRCEADNDNGSFKFVLGSSNCHGEAGNYPTITLFESEIPKGMDFNSFIDIQYKNYREAFTPPLDPTGDDPDIKRYPDEENIQNGNEFTVKYPGSPYEYKFSEKTMNIDGKKAIFLGGTRRTQGYTEDLPNKFYLELPVNRVLKITKGVTEEEIIKIFMDMISTVKILQ